MALCLFSENTLTNIRKLSDKTISNIKIAVMIKNNMSVVIKKVKNPQIDEVNKWDHIYNHSNIVEFLGIYSIKNENQSFLIMPFANDGNLRNYLENNNTLSFNKKLEIAIDIANGIRFLHKNDIVHENINPRNILVFNGIAKISNLPDNDLYSRNKELYFGGKLFDNVGYIDPNSVLNRNYKKNKSADIYSLGILLWEIMSEQIPYSDNRDDGILQLIMRIKEGYREADVISNPKYVNLYKNCWDGNEFMRPKIDDIYEQLLNLRIKPPPKI